MKSLAHYLLLLSLALPSVVTQAQNNTAQPTSSYFDMTDLRKVIQDLKGKVDTVEKNPVPEKGKLMLMLVPAVGSNPSLGTFYGLAGTGALFLGEPSTTNISSLSASALFTTKAQFIASIKGTIMTPNNTWEILSDLRFSKFSESTYGLGSDYQQPIQEDWTVGGVTTEGINGPQPMTFSRSKNSHYTAAADHREIIRRHRPPL